MAFRDARNLAEHLRVLGFPRLVSVANFSSPNFHLVSEVLAWAMRTVDNNLELPYTLETEQDRIIFVRTAALFFFDKLGLYLSPVWLYGAERLAVQELLKITSELHRAYQSATFPQEANEDSQAYYSSSNTITIKELCEARQLASNIIQGAASLCDSLNQEVLNKVRRRTVLEQPLDLSDMEACVVAALHALAEMQAQVQQATQNSVCEGEQVEEKIKSKKECLMRKKKRLETIEKIKPSWHVDFDYEETRLQTMWNKYITKHRNLAYLENLLERVTTGDPDCQAAVKNQKLLIAGKKCSGLLMNSSSDSIQSLQEDSASDDDSATFSSPSTSKALNNEQAHKGKPLIPPTKPVSIPAVVPKSSLFNVGGRPVTGVRSVRGSGRVSPLSASDDENDA